MVDNMVASEVRVKKRMSICVDSRFWVFDFEFWVLNFGFWFDRK